MEELYFEEEENPHSEKEEPATKPEEEEGGSMPTPPPKRMLREWATPNVDEQPLFISYSVEEVNVELKTGLIHLLLHFHGLDNEDLYKQMIEFSMVCLGMKLQGTTVEHLSKLKTFPFSLVGVARE